MRRVHEGLRVVFWGALVGSVASLAATAMYAWFLRRIWAGESAASAIDTVQVVGNGALAVELLAAIAVLVGLTAVASDEKVRAPARVALVAGSLGLAASLVANFWRPGGPGLVPGSATMLVWRAGLIASLCCGIVVGVAMWRLVRRLGPAPRWLDVALVAYPVWLLGESLFGLLSPRADLVRLGITVVVEAARLAALWHATRLGGLPTAIADVDELGGPTLRGEAWRACAKGLATYRGAVLAKLVLLGGGAVLLAATVATRSPGLGKAVGVLWPLADLIATLALIGGLLGYGAVPHESGARSTSVLATASALFTLCVQVYGVWLLWRALDGDSLDDRLPVIEGVGQLLALAGMLLLLASFRALAAFLALPRVAARTGWVSLAVVVVMAGGLGLRWAATRESFASGEALLTLGALVLVAAIATLVAYLGVLAALLGELRRRLSDAPAG